MRMNAATFHAHAYWYVTLLSSKDLRKWSFDVAYLFKSIHNMPTSNNCVSNPKRASTESVAIVL